MGFLGVFMMNWCGLPVFQYPNDVWLVTGIVVFFFYWFMPHEKETALEKFVVLIKVATVSLLFIPAYCFNGGR